MLGETRSKKNVWSQFLPGHQPLRRGFNSEREDRRGFALFRDEKRKPCWRDPQVLSHFGLGTAGVGFKVFG